MGRSTNIVERCSVRVHSQAGLSGRADNVALVEVITDPARGGRIVRLAVELTGVVCVRNGYLAARNREGGWGVDERGGRLVTGGGLTRAGAEVVCGGQERSGAVTEGVVGEGWGRAGKVTRGETK